MNDHDYLARQLDVLLILQSMYPLPSEFVLSPPTSLYIENQDKPGYEPPSTLEATLNIQSEEDETYSLELVLSLPTSSSSPSSSSASSDNKLYIRQPPWVSRSGYDDLLAHLPSPENIVSPVDTILDTVDTLRSQIPNHITPDSTLQGTNEGVVGDIQELQRVWFWFPSLSTKEKRRDLVDYAPKYNLTGFVLAGKPGLLCLEGESRNVDRYMSAIKSESWSDIPSYQKKVTERLRKPLPDGKRAFEDMREITHLIPQYGQYNHRGEMGEVRRLMDTWGVGEDFGAVVLNSAS